MGTPKFEPPDTREPWLRAATVGERYAALRQRIVIRPPPDWGGNTRSITEAKKPSGRKAA